MSKALLVMDMPKCCRKCDLMFHAEPCFCSAKLKEINSRDKFVERPDWCPLKPIPEKANHPDWCDGGRYDKGYNACIDEILGSDEKE